MWALIISAVIIAAVGGIVYMTTRIPKFSFAQSLIKNKKLLYLCSAAFTVSVMAVLYFTLGFMNSAVCLIHAMLIWLICDIVGAVIKKCTQKSTKHYYAGVAAVVVTVLYLCGGAFLAHHVFRTEYDIKPSKNITAPLKVVMFSDSHMGTTFDWAEFSEYIDKMNDEDPDVVVIAGDYVDDDTSLENMEKSCQALGRLKTKYGVYYVFGNHDAGYYGDEYRGYGKKELIENLEKNGVTVLQDESVNIEGNVYICGRQDRIIGDRADMKTLMSNIPKDAYTIVLDHQPSDYKAQMSEGAGLVLSGHTHGGQFIPINRLGELMGANDKTYGHEKISDTDFIVSSGIGDWALDFKTGCISEYVVINIG